MLSWRCLRDLQLEMACEQGSVGLAGKEVEDRAVNRMLSAQSRKLRAAKGHVKPCDHLGTGFCNHTRPIKEVLIMSTVRAEVEIIA